LSTIIIHKELTDLSLERMKRHLSKTPAERLMALVQLNEFALKLSGRSTLGKPQGKGLVIRKINK
jgi:MarR-like DNA-binding transcriptional regulator SgrR of sgrS sRNA